MLLSFDRFAALKAAVHPHCIFIGSSHLAEILAFGFGYKTNRSLRARLQSGEFSANFDLDKAIARATELGYQLPELPADAFEDHHDKVIKVVLSDQAGAVISSQRVKYVDEGWNLFTMLVSSCEKGWKLGVISEEEDSNYHFMFECTRKSSLDHIDLSDQLRIFGIMKTGESYDKRYAGSLERAWQQLTDIAKFLAIGERVFVRPVFGEDLIEFRCLEGFLA